jgi:RecG-like helicase
MGLRDLAKRLRASIDELDDERLQDRFSGLGLTTMGELEPRTPARVGGEVTRTRIAPRSGVPAYEITISDGTGSVVAVFTGRRQVAGLEHHRAVLVEGVARSERGRLVMLNPAYTLLPR